MTPNIEQLEPRCVLSAALDLGTIGPRLDYGPAIEVQWGDSVPLATMPPDGGYATAGTPYVEQYHYWAIAPALTQVDVWAGLWPNFVGPGEWDVLHVVLTPESPMNYVFASLQRFTLPHAESVGIGLSGGTVTVYQTAFGSLWSTSTNDDGMSWSAWQQVTPLLAVAPTAPAPSLAPFGWLADMDAYEPGQDLDGDGWPDAPGVEHAKAVYGLILATDNGIRVGYEIDSIRFSGLVHDGELTTEAVDALFLEGEWLDQTEVWLR